MSETVSKIIAMTVLLVVVYYFFRDGDQTNKIISSGARGYALIVNALQGQQVSQFSQLPTL